MAELIKHLFLTYSILFEKRFFNTGKLLKRFNVLPFCIPAVRSLTYFGKRMLSNGRMWIFETSQVEKVRNVENTVSFVDKTMKNADAHNVASRIMYADISIFAHRAGGIPKVDYHDRTVGVLGVQTPKLGVSVCS